MVELIRYPTEEIWVPIKGFDGKYEVSNKGRIRSYVGWKARGTDIPRVLKESYGNSGYKQVCLVKEGKHYMRMTHRIVAETFLKNDMGLREVNHKDGNKSNNELSNLEWTSRSGNLKHAYKSGLRKFSDKQLKRILERTKPVEQVKDGIVVNEFISAAEAHRKTDISRQDIGQCCLGRLKRAGGYEWRFKE